MSEQQNPYDVIDPAFRSQAKLNEALADETLNWDRTTKTRMRKEVNLLKGMMEEVLKVKDELPGDLIEGMEEVIVNAEAKLDGKPMHFRADEEVHYGQAA